MIERSAAKRPLPRWSKHCLYPHNNGLRTIRLNRVQSENGSAGVGEAAVPFVLGDRAVIEPEFLAVTA